MPSRPMSRRKFLQSLATSAAVGVLKPGWKSRAAGGSGLTHPGILQPHSVQLHIHASSNHNGGRGQPASVQWQSDWASEQNLETLWWSEHYQTMYPNTDFVVPLETGALDRTTWSVINLANPFPHGLHSGPYEHRHPRDGACCLHTLPEAMPGGPEAVSTLAYYAQQMQATITGGGTSSATLTGPELSWSIRAGSTTSQFQYAPRSSDGIRVWGYYLCKALFTDVVITLDVWRGAVSTNQKCQISVELSYHRVGLNRQAIAQTILYDLVAQSGPPVVNGQQVTVPVAIPARTWTSITLHPTQDAQLLTDGLDNTIQDIRFTVIASNFQTAEMKIRNLNIHSNQQDGPTNWQSGKELAEGYQARYPGLTAVYGIEMSLNNAQHLNPFLYRGVNQLPDPDWTADQLTAWAHSLGGLVSFNHPFGASVGLTPNLAQQDQMVVDTANTLMAASVYGADLIEIYDRRVVDLEHHLRLWDILTANGYRLLGIGTSDSHGGPWQEDYNYYVTWIWAEGPDEDSLLAGMLSRLMYFGSPYRFSSGSLNYSAGGVNMGGITTVQSNQTTVSLQLTGSQPTWERRLRQYLIQPGTSLVNLVGTPQQPWLVFSGDTVTIDTSRSSFIRIEIWDTTDRKPVAFGQTIVLNRG